MSHHETHCVNWKLDNNLKEQLETFVHQNLQRSEILSFVERDYPLYRWSIRTLDRRLRFFNIYYTDRTVDVGTIQDAVKLELEGPGKLLGYRSMQQKLRQIHKLNVPRALVHDVMFDLNPDGLQERAPMAKKNKKGTFTSKGTNWVHSMDGHDKLCGYQNSTFPLAIYGSIDTASRRILWLRIWTSNSDPKLIGRWYLDYLYESRKMSSMIRVDKGTETGIMATMHAFLRQGHDDMDPVDTVIYGPSTSNQIERWWKELHERLEGFFKDQLAWLKDQGHYNPHDEDDRLLLAFLMIPVVEKELNIFKNIVWNNHRIRHQKNTRLPDGVPNHIYEFPHEYSLEECGFPIAEHQLQEVAEYSGVLNVPDDFLKPDFRRKCEAIIPNPDMVRPQDCKDAFIFLKANIKC